MRLKNTQVQSAVMSMGKRTVEWGSVEPPFVAFPVWILASFVAKLFLGQFFMTKYISVLFLGPSHAELPWALRARILAWVACLLPPPSLWTGHPIRESDLRSFRSSGPRLVAWLPHWLPLLPLVSAPSPQPGPWWSLNNFWILIVQAAITQQRKFGKYRET